MCNTRYCRNVYPDGSTLDYNRIKWCPSVRRGEPCPDAARPVGDITREVRYVEAPSSGHPFSAPPSHLPPTPPRSSPSRGDYYGDEYCDYGYPEGHRLERKHSRKHSNSSSGSNDRGSRRRLSNLFFGDRVVEKKPERRRSTRRVVVEHEPSTPVSPLPRDHEFRFSRTDSSHEANPFTPISDSYPSRPFDDADATHYSSHRPDRYSRRSSRIYDPDRVGGTIRRRRNSYIEEEARRPVHRYIEDGRRDSPSRRDFDLAEAEILRQRRRAAKNEGFSLSGDEPIIRDATIRDDINTSSKSKRSSYMRPSVEDAVDDEERTTKPVISRGDGDGPIHVKDDDDALEKRLEIARIRAEIMTRKEMEAKGLKGKSEAGETGRRTRARTRVTWDDGSSYRYQ